MIYTSVSIDEVIAKVIRNTRITDSSYIADMAEWIPEAMARLRTKYELEKVYQDVCIEFHKGALPCGTVHTRAIEHKGHRLMQANSSRSLDAPRSTDDVSNAPLGTTNGFLSIMTQRNTPEDSIIYDSTAVQLVTINEEQCRGLPCETGAWYEPDMDFITTSFATGIIRVHVTRIKLDNNGLPRIPDNENYKEALYYYVRAKMIESGYDDKVFTWDKLMMPVTGLFETIGARAIGQIRYPAVDSMEAKVNGMTRLIPAENYFDQFFSTPNAEKDYGFDYYSHPR